MSSLVAHAVSCRIGNTDVLRHVDMVADPGLWTAIIGPNGAGKSTLVRCLAGLQQHRGTVNLDNSELQLLSLNERARSVAYAPQLPVMPPAMTVRQYVALGRSPYQRSWFLPRSKSDIDIDDIMISQALDALDVRHLEHRTLNTLSGGERQRTVLAQVLAQRSSVIILDEPTTALDLGHQQHVLQLIDEARKKLGSTIVTTLHDLTAAGQYADHIVLLHHGRVAASGPPADVLTTPIIESVYQANVQVAVDDCGRVTVRSTRSADRQ